MGSIAGRQAYARYWDAAVDIPGPVTEAIAAVAAATQTYVVIGIIERDRTYRGGTLYGTMLYFGPDGSILGKHRKLKPTGAERLIWGEGDGGIPVWFKVGSGNETDSQSFAGLMRAFAKQWQTPTLMVADAAFYSEPNLQQVGSLPWLSRVPQTLKAAPLARYLHFFPLPIVPQLWSPPHGVPQCSP